MEENLSQSAYFSNKKFLLALFILLAIGLGAYLALFVFQPKSQEFSGNISSINGNSILVKGYFMVNGKLYNQAGGHLRDVEVSVTPETKFNATVLYSPTNAELAKTNGKWDMSAIRKEEISGSIADLASVSLIFIETDNNIFNQSKFNAKTIIYTIIKNPENYPSHLCEASKGEFIVNGVCVKK